MKKTVNSKLYANTAKFLFPVILIALCFLNVRKGIDVSDSGYGFTNFLLGREIDGMWYYSTLLSNVLGRVLTFLPYGSTLLGINLYLALVKAMMVFWIYNYLTKKALMNREAVFFGLLMAISLCWAPNLCFYHYLSYYSLAAMVIFMDKAIRKADNRYFFVAGIIAGLGVFARFPNICNVALIAALWWYGIITHSKLSSILRSTFRCILGFLTAILLGVVFIWINGGTIKAYVTGILDLFAMTDEASSYGIKATLVNLVNSYTCVFYWLIPLLALFLLLLGLGFSEGYVKRFSKPFAVLGVLLVYAFWFIRGLFVYDFASYESIYLFGVVILSLFVLLLCCVIFCRRFTAEERFLCTAALIIQFVTPMGSNNSLYAVLNNLFIVAPVVFYMTVRLYKYRRLRVLQVGLISVFSLYLIHSLIFGASFTFRDSKPYREVSDNEVLKGMKTNEINAVFFEDLGEISKDYRFERSLVLTFGDMPGIVGFMGYQPALSTTWPTLSSFSEDKFSRDMDLLQKRMDTDYRDVVVFTDVHYYLEGRKQDILKKFLEDNRFYVLYDNGDLKIWIMEDR